MMKQSKEVGGSNPPAPSNSAALAWILPIQSPALSIMDQRSRLIGGVAQWTERRELRLTSSDRTLLPRQLCDD